MSWGKSYYGTAFWGTGLGFEAGATRLLYVVRMGPNFRALSDIIDTRFNQVIGVMNQIIMAFDLDTATGAQLEIVGAWLGLPRDGMPDEQYRRALKVQRTTILSSTGTGPVLRQIVEDWTGVPATSYRDVPPANVEIGAVVDPADEEQLIYFLNRAKPAGVRLFPLVASEGPLLVGHHTVSVADAGYIGHHTVAVAGAKLIAHLG